MAVTWKKVLLQDQNATVGALTVNAGTTHAVLLAHQESFSSKDSGGTARALVRMSGDDVIMGNHHTGSLILYSADTTALTINSSQNATFAGSLTSGGAFLVKGSQINMGADGGTANRFRIQAGSGADAELSVMDARAFRIKTNDTTRLTIDGGGETTIQPNLVIVNQDSSVNNGQANPSLTLDGSTKVQFRQFSSNGRVLHITQNGVITAESASAPTLTKPNTSWGALDFVLFTSDSTGEDATAGFFFNTAKTTEDSSLTNRFFIGINGNIGVHKTDPQRTFHLKDGTFMVEKNGQGEVASFTETQGAVDVNHDAYILVGGYYNQAQDNTIISPLQMGYRNLTTRIGYFKLKGGSDAFHIDATGLTSFQSDVLIEKNANVALTLDSTGGGSSRIYLDALNSNGEYGELIFQTSGTTKSRIYHHRDGILNLQTGGTTTALTLDQNQNATFVGDVVLGKNNDSLKIYGGGTQYLNLSGNVVKSLSAGLTLIGGQMITMRTNSDSSSADALILDTSQNATFSGAVTVNGSNVTVANASNPYIYLNDTSGGAGIFQQYDAYTAIGSDSNHEFRLLQNNGTAVTIDTSKNATFVGDVTAKDVYITDNSGGDRPALFISNSYDNSSPSIIQFKRNRATATDGDQIGQISFYADNSANENTQYGWIKGLTADVSNGTEDGKLQFSTKIGGSDKEALGLTGGTATFSGAVITGYGDVSKPAHAFTGDTDTGMYRKSSNSIGFSTGGNLAMTLSGQDVQCGDTFKASTGHSGTTDTASFIDDDGERHTIVIKDGLIIGWDVS